MAFNQLGTETQLFALTDDHTLGEIIVTSDGDLAFATRYAYHNIDNQTFGNSAYHIFDPTSLASQSVIVGTTFSGAFDYQDAAMPFFLPGGEYVVSTENYSSGTFPIGSESSYEIRDLSDGSVVYDDAAGGMFDFFSFQILQDGSLVAYFPGSLAQIINPATQDVLSTNGGHAVSLDGERTLFWLPGTDASGASLDAQIYDPTAGTLTASFQVNTTEAGDQTGLTAHDIAGSDDIFLAWTDGGGDGSGSALRGRFVDPANPGASTDFLINTTAAGDQTLSDVVALDNGRLLAVWEHGGGDGSGNSLRARIIDPASPNGSIDFAVNTTTPGNQTLLEAIELSGGRAILVWDDAGGDGSGNAIRARIVDLSNPAASSDFLVNTTAAGSQQLVDTRVLADGRVLLTWSDAGGDGSGNSLRARIVNPANPATGTDFQVNTTAAGNQTFNSLFELADGRLVYFWDGDQGDGAGAGIRMRIVNPANPAAGADAVVNVNATSGDQTIHSVTAITGGQLLVVFADTSSTGHSLYQYRIVDPAAPASGTSIPIGDASLIDQRDLQIHDLGDGRIAFTWVEGTGTESLKSAIYDTRASGVTLNGNGTDQSLAGTVFADTIDGGGGKDHVVGYAGNDRLSGGSGDDYLDGGAGIDTMIGGAGIDRYIVDHAYDVVDETTGTAGEEDIVLSYIQVSLLDTVHFKGDIETVQLLGTGSINVTGNALDNRLIGNSGANILNGGIGADWLQGRGGDDNYVVDNAGDLVDESLGGSTGIDLVRSIVSFSLSNTAQAKGAIENLSLLGAGNIDGTGNALANLITGNNGDNVLMGAAGNDMLVGGGGNDTLDGGAQIDTMQGGAGNDIYVVDNAADIVDENTAGAGGVDTVRSAISFSLLDTTHAKGAIENVTLLGTANLNVAGNALDNTLTGNSGANQINGGAGADMMRGGGGNDTYTVDNIGDRVDESVAGSGGIDTVRSTVSFNLGSQTLGFVENVSLFGSANLNVFGNSGANVLIGNSGNNIVAGGNGNDTLTGGAGNDIFLFNAPLHGALNVDTITDMNEIGNDTIWLENAVFTALGAGPLSVGAFQHSLIGAIEADDRIIYNAANGQLIYDSNGNAAGGSTLIAILDAGLPLTAADFVVV